MTAKEYLSRAGQVDMEYWKIARRIQDLRMQMSPISGISYDNVHVMTSPAKTSRTERQIIELVDAENELAAELLKVMNERRKIIDEIAELKDQRLIQVLELKYIDDLSLIKISEMVHYSYVWVRKLHRQALDLFAEIHGLEKSIAQDTDSAQ